MRRAAGLLDDEMVAANFDFYGTTLTGAPQLRERWKRGVGLVEGALGEAVGELYVGAHFPPAAKARMVELVDNLVAAYRVRLEALAWMSPDTRERALAKLAAFTPKIGYPDTWRNFDALAISADDLVGNTRRAALFEARYEWAKLGGPVDRLEWFMTPQTVNAYYNPGMNEIVFPAAILQPPFFDLEADDAVNYGAIGAVIGHEIGHGFDDQGSRYDGSGNLVDWWTEADRARFDELAGRLIAQFDGLRPRGLSEGGVNGALTVGENIGDLGGVTVALQAYRISLGGQQPTVLDGLTGEQRFFLGWAQAWRAKYREAEAIRLLTIDPHSPAEFRCNIVANLDEFHGRSRWRPGTGCGAILPTGCDLVAAPGSAAVPPGPVRLRRAAARTRAGRPGWAARPAPRRPSHSLGPTQGQLGGHLTHPLRIVGDHADAQRGGQLEVVEPEQADRVGPARGRPAAPRWPPGCCRRRPHSAGRSEPSSAAVALVAEEMSAPSVRTNLGSTTQAVGLQGVAVAGQPLAVGVQRLGTADERDPTVPGGEQGQDPGARTAPGCRTPRSRSRHWTAVGPRPRSGCRTAARPRGSRDPRRSARAAARGSAARAGQPTTVASRSASSSVAAMSIRRPARASTRSTPAATSV